MKRIFCLFLVLSLMAVCALAENDGPAVKGVFTGGFSERYKEESAQSGKVDCLVVFDCAGKASQVTLTAGSNTYEAFDTGSNLCKYIVNLHRYCGYAEPLYSPEDAARKLALFYVDPADLTGDMTLAVDGLTTVIPSTNAQAIELPDDILSVEDDSELAHRLADWRWRMDSIIHFDSFCEKVYINRVQLISGDNFKSLCTAFENVVDENIPYGISIAAEPNGSFSETDYGILFDGGAYGLTDAEPPLDLSVVMRSYPGQVGLIQYLVDNSRAAAKAMVKTSDDIDQLRQNVGIAYLDLCDAIGLPDLGEFYKLHPAAQRTGEFIESLRASGEHIPAEDIAKAEAKANDALKGNKELVKAIQQAMNDAGFDCGTPDGSAGKKTAASISAYQEANGLEVTGEISYTLLQALGL